MSKKNKKGNKKAPITVPVVETRLQEIRRRNKITHESYETEDGIIKYRLIQPTDPIPGEDMTNQEAIDYITSVLSEIKGEPVDIKPAEPVEVIGAVDTENDCPFDTEKDVIDADFKPVEGEPAPGLSLKFRKRSDGKSALDDFKDKKEEKVKLRINRAETEHPTDDDPVDIVKMFGNYHKSALEEAIAELLTCIDTGMYNMGYVQENVLPVIEYAKAYLDGKPVTGSIIQDIIVICKSYYEYDKDQRTVLPDAIYDRVVAHWIKDGNTEPTGKVAETKGKSKVDIKYHTLHNNLAKTYRCANSEPIPEGVKENDSVEAFLQRSYAALTKAPSMEIEVELSPKLDGVSINGTIVGNRLMAPQTRGDSSKSLYVVGLNDLQVCDHDPGLGTFGIQYEAFVTDENLIKASEHLGLATPYVSRRHAASGIIHRLCMGPDPVLASCISLYPIATEGLEGTYLERMSAIELFGIVPKDMLKRTVFSSNLRDLVQMTWYSINHGGPYGASRPNLSYAIDGVVLTIVDDDMQKELGRDGRSNNFQVAYKFDPSSAVATVSGITLDRGLKGYRTIQVNLQEPVILDDVRYTHVPVLSHELYTSLGLTKGSTVNIHRVGDVIPSITVDKINKKGKLLETPTCCPDCGREFKIKARKLYCDNPECPGNVIGKITGFIASMGVDGYSTSFAEMVYNRMNAHTIADVLNLTPEAFKAAGIKTKVALEFHEKIHKAISKADDFTIVGAMGLPGIGTSKAKFLLSKISLEELIGKSEEFMYALAKELVGEVMSVPLGNAMISASFKDDVKAIIPLITRVTTDFNKISVGHTGAFDVPANFREICDRNGLEYIGGKKFDILITASRDSDSDKMKKAAKKNLPVYTIEEFLKIYK